MDLKEMRVDVMSWLRIKITGDTLLFCITMYRLPSEDKSRLGLPDHVHIAQYYEKCMGNSNIAGGVCRVRSAYKRHNLLLTLAPSCWSHCARADFPEGSVQQTTSEGEAPVTGELLSFPLINNSVLFPSPLPSAFVQLSPFI